MKKEIIKKLGLIETDITNGVSFVNDIKFYQYRNVYLVAGNIDGTIEENGLITAFSKRSGKSLKISVDFLTDCDVSIIEKTILDALDLTSKKMKFIIETGKVDSHNNKLNIDGLKIPGQMVLTEQFSNDRIVSDCKVFKEEGVLKAEADVPKYLLNGFPSIGFNILKSKFDEEKGVYEIEEADLKYVSINKNPNVDPSIKRLSEQ